MQKQAKPYVKTFKTRVYLTEEQKNFLNSIFGCYRYIYNRLLYEITSSYESFLKSVDPRNLSENIELINDIKFLISPSSLKYKLFLIKSEEDTIWLDNVPYKVLEQSVLDLSKDLTHYFENGSDYPKFKKKKEYQTLTLTEGWRFKLKEGKLYIGNFKEPLDVIFSVELQPNPTSITISKTSLDEYYISFNYEYIPI